MAGTRDYIAPELFTGARPGVRSDLYSLGVILFQMATGRMSGAPENPSAIDPLLPSWFCELVVSLIARDPAARPDAAEGVRRALTESRTSSRAGSHSLAVLPFKQLSADPDNEHLGVGLADATITELALVRSLVVRPTASILRYNGELEQARQKTEQSIAADVTPARFYPVLALIAALQGDFARAEEESKRTIRHRKEYGHFHHAQYDLACAASVRGDVESAFQLLAAVAANGFPCFPLFRSDPFLKGLQHEPRMIELTMRLERESRDLERTYREVSA